jgi:predicted amidohydrolase
MTALKIALAQIDCFIGDVAANLEKIAKIVEDASADGAQLIVFPELALTGYNLNLLAGRVHELAAESDEVIAELKRAAKEGNIAIICGISLKKDQLGAICNSAAVIDATGDYLGSYDKTHAFGAESSTFELGTSFPIFTVCGGVKVGVMICYDAGFPEVARILAAQGADLIVCPAAWLTEERFLWDSNLRSRAVDNLIPVLGVNRVGLENDLTFFGGSQVVNSKGEILFQAGEKESVSIYELDMQDFLKTRQKYKHMDDLRLELYASQLSSIYSNRFIR